MKLLLYAYFFSFSLISRDFNFDQVFHENNYSKAYKAAAKTFYLIDNLNKIGPQGLKELIYLQLWQNSLNSYFYVRLIFKKERDLKTDDIACLININNKILERLSENCLHDLCSSAKNVFIESNKVLEKIICPTSCPS